MTSLSDMEYLVAQAPHTPQNNLGVTFERIKNMLLWQEVCTRGCMGEWDPHLRFLFVLFLLGMHAHLNGPRDHLFLRQLFLSFWIFGHLDVGGAVFGERESLL